MPEDQSLPEIQCRFPLKFWWMNHPEPPPSYISVFPEICRGNSELESICSAAAVLIQVRALQNRERFEEVEGLLSTPVLMYDPEAVQDLSGLEEEALKEIAACLVFCINWLRTVISQFGFLCHEDPETTVVLRRRLGDLVEISDLVENISQRIPILDKVERFLFMSNSDSTQKASFAPLSQHFFKLLSFPVSESLESNPDHLNVTRTSLGSSVSSCSWPSLPT